MLLTVLSMALSTAAGSTPALTALRLSSASDLPDSAGWLV